MICFNVPELAFCGACADTIKEMTTKKSFANLVIVFPSAPPNAFECSLALSVRFMAAPSRKSYPPASRASQIIHKYWIKILVTFDTQRDNFSDTKTRQF